MAEPEFARNLRRLMVREGLTIAQVVARTGVDQRTIKSLLHTQPARRPHARTLHRLAQGLGVSTDELFVGASRAARQLFDRQTNPLVDQAIQRFPQRFAGWSEADFDELYSHFGMGGALTVDGALAVAERLNRKRQVLDKVALVLETAEGCLLSDFVELLYRRVALEPDPPQPDPTRPTPRAQLAQPAAAAAPADACRVA